MVASKASGKQPHTVKVNEAKTYDQPKLSPKSEAVVVGCVIGKVLQWLKGREF